MTGNRATTYETVAWIGWRTATDRDADLAGKFVEYASRKICQRRSSPLDRHRARGYSGHEEDGLMC
jgi:hypothetical protein